MSVGRDELRMAERTEAVCEISPSAENVQCREQGANYIQLYKNAFIFSVTNPKQRKSTGMKLIC